MLTIDPDIVFDSTASIKLRGLQASFGVRCRFLNVERLTELEQARTDGKLTPRQFIDSWIVGWADGEVRGADEAPLPFTPQNLDLLLNVPGAVLALIRAFYRGYEDATEGNSGPLPAGS